MDNNLKLLEIISSVLEIDQTKINDATSPENTDTWDSFNALVLASELEDGFDVSFTIEEVEGVTCVLDIKKCLKNHGILIE